jgi:predicted transcriptional regulator
MLPDIREIRILRKKLGLTQKQLAKLAGVSQSLIAKIEAGLIDASYRNVSRILESLIGFGKKSEPKARELASGKVVGTVPSEKLSDAVAKMKKYGISQLPVLERGQLTGMISEGDVLESIHTGKNVATLSVKDVMQDAPPTVPAETPLSTVTELLRISQMVAVMEKGKILGVVTKADVLKRIKG